MSRAQNTKPRLFAIIKPKLEIKLRNYKIVYLNVA